MAATLRSRFPQIMAELRPRTLAGIKTGVEVVAQEAKGRVPVDQGDLRDAIHTSPGSGGHYVIAGDSDIFYGHMVEFGTSHSSPRPFLVPALEAQREEIVTLVALALRDL